jgi:hypothetical protein
VPEVTSEAQGFSEVSDQALAASRSFISHYLRQCEPIASADAVRNVHAPLEQYTRVQWDKIAWQAINRSSECCMMWQTLRILTWSPPSRCGEGIPSGLN